MTPPPLWSEVDWSKTNKLLAFTLDVPVAVVAYYRHAVGRPRHEFNGKVDWETLDWSKNNQQLSQENGLALQKVKLAREVLKKGPGTATMPPNGEQHANRIITDEMIAAAPWAFAKDADLARQWHISRERVRQIRMEHAKPVCLVNCVSLKSKRFETWLFENRATLEGKMASYVANLSPEEMPRCRKFQIMRKTSIQFLWREVRGQLCNRLPINWGLPNTVITAVWGKCSGWAGNARMNYNKGGIAWDLNEGIGAGFLGRMTLVEITRRHPEHLETVKVEIRKAIEVGVTPRWAELAKFGLADSDFPNGNGHVLK